MNIDDDSALLFCMQHEKKTYDILVKQLGEEDSRTRDSQNWMKTFKMRELQVLDIIIYLKYDGYRLYFLRDISSIALLILCMIF